MRLPRDFYARPAREVAIDLLGTRLVRRLGPGRSAVGRVVEVEAYLGPHDLASHAAHGRTPRTEVMYGPPGHAYVYFVYGMHHCLNVVTDPEGTAAAVLLRALEPLQNLAGPTSGPGRLCRALSIDRSLNGADLLGDELFLEAGAPPRRVRSTARIGVDYAGRWARRRLRFFDAESPHVSATRRR